MKHKIENPTVLERNATVFLDTLRFEMKDLAAANLLAIVLGRHAREIECVCAEERADIDAQVADMGWIGAFLGANTFDLAGVAAEHDCQ